MRDTNHIADNTAIHSNNQTADSKKTRIIQNHQNKLPHTTTDNTSHSIESKKILNESLKNPFGQSTKNYAAIKQFIGYFFVSLLALFANLMSRYFLNFFMSFWLSVVIAYIIGHFVNFSLSSIFIFPSQYAEGYNWKITFWKFSLVALIGLVVALYVSVFSLSLLQHYLPSILSFLESSSSFTQNKHFSLDSTAIEFLAHISGVGAGFILNFLGHKHFSFTKANLRKPIYKE
ncbi:GtrA family protein [Helicobacter aurati]|uniref:GtrA family protein n=1 Tax=Helicobacter aurati TaxID=137778 RepID=A0A3D8J1Z2_9HELI|nr:GtrA family protein [Helicobacter aurati]RDU71559.1 GtrA family protein [Helicobacter aurati]